MSRKKLLILPVISSQNIYCAVLHCLQSVNSCYLNIGTYLRNAAIFLFNASEAFSKFIDLEQTWERKQKITTQPLGTLKIFSYR